MDGDNGNKKRKRETNDDALVVANALGFVRIMSRIWAIKPATSGENLVLKIENIRKAIDFLARFKKFVTKNPPDRWGYAEVPAVGNRPGGRINFTDRNAQSYIDSSDSYLRSLLADTIVLEQTNRSLAATMMKPGDGLRCGDGNCHIQFVNIGLGDCTTISSPNGFRIMIDMGSLGMTDIKTNWTFDPNTQKKEITEKTVTKILLDTIKQKIFLGTDKLINMLILTHTDGDHHNKLSQLGDDIKIGRVYFSGQKIERYSGSSAYIKGRVTKSGIKKVDVRIDEKSKKQVRTINDIQPPILESSAKKGYPDNEYIDKTTEAIVLYEEDNGFKISILASNVSGVYLNDKDRGLIWIKDDAVIKTDPRENKFKKNSTRANRCSQVVLVEFNGKKAIITGDATAVTEYFMATRPAYDAVLKNVNAYRLPHHGSPTSSSMKIIDKLVGVKELVASCSGRYTRKHGLPKQDILNSYSAPSGDEHFIWAFPLTVDEGSSTQQKYTKKVYATGSNGTRIYTF